MRTPTPVGHAEVTRDQLKELSRPLEKTFSRANLSDAGHREVSRWLSHTAVLSHPPYAGRTRTSPEHLSGWDPALKQVVEGLGQAYVSAVDPDGRYAGLFAADRQRWAENVCNRLVNEMFQVHRGAFQPCGQADLDIDEAIGRLPGTWLQARTEEGHGQLRSAVAAAQAALLEALARTARWDLDQPVQLVRIYMSDGLARIAAHVGAYAHVQDAVYASETILAASPLVVSCLVSARHLGAKPSRHIGAVHPPVDRHAAVTMAASLTVEMPDSRLLDTVNGLLG